MAEPRETPLACIEHHTLLRATRDDVPSIQNMVKAAYSKYIERMGKEPAPMKADYANLVETEDVFVLQSDKERKLVGAIVLCAGNDADSLQVNNLVVDPAAQGRGYGRVLMECAEDVARMKGRETLMLYTNIKMYENLGMYQKMGFEETERKTEDGYERVYFRKSI